MKIFSLQEELVHPPLHLSTMQNCPGEGCGYKTKNDRALSTHIRQCQKAQTVFALIAEDVRQPEADHREAKRRKVSSLGQSEVGPEVEEPMDVDLEVSFIVYRSKSG